MIDATNRRQYAVELSPFGIVHQTADLLSSREESNARVASESRVSRALSLTYLHRFSFLLPVYRRGNGGKKEIGWRRMQENERLTGLLHRERGVLSVLTSNISCKRWGR